MGWDWETGSDMGNVSDSNCAPYAAQSLQQRQQGCCCPVLSKFLFE